MQVLTSIYSGTSGATNMVAERITSLKAAHGQAVEILEHRVATLINIRAQLEDQLYRAGFASKRQQALHKQAVEILENKVATLINIRARLEDELDLARLGNKRQQTRHEQAVEILETQVTTLMNDGTELQDQLHRARYGNSERAEKMRYEAKELKHRTDIEVASLFKELTDCKEMVRGLKEEVFELHTEVDELEYVIELKQRENERLEAEFKAAEEVISSWE